MLIFLFRCCVLYRNRVWKSGNVKWTRLQKRVVQDSRRTFEACSQRFVLDWASVQYLDLICYNNLAGNRKEGSHHHRTITATRIRRVRSAAPQARHSRSRSNHQSTSPPHFRIHSPTVVLGADGAAIAERDQSRNRTATPTTNQSTLCQFLTLFLSFRLCSYLFLYLNRARV